MTSIAASQNTSYRYGVSGSSPVNPFVGLRPFNTDEAMLFFGRGAQTIELLEHLHRARFLAVVGSSGCGKSSLIRAGLIPKLEAGFLVEDRDRWRIAVMKPGDSPLRNLAASLLNAISLQSNDTDINGFIDEIRSAGSQTIIERLAPALADTDTSLLLLVDQFEEIFRFNLQADKVERRDEAADFISIMLAVAAQRELPIYIVMTMRSDFLGDCDSFYGLPEAMNRGQYLVPRPTRQQRGQAIEGPIRLFGAQLTQRLLDRLLNDVGDQTDQLPVLQHALMRTWEEWKRSGDPKLDLCHYEAVGTIKDALSRDADKAIAGMSEQDLKITQRLFQALTTRDERGRRIRRPAHQSEIEAITGASSDQVRTVVERFRSGGRSFLNLDEGSGDSLIDISHESLIRQWDRLGRWVDEESEAASTYLQIVDVAVRHARGRAGLWGNPDLQIALDWRAKQRPNKAWAERYHSDFETAMSFLDRSLRKRKLTFAMRALSIAAIVIIAVAVLLIVQRKLQQDRFQESVRIQQERMRDAIEATVDGLYRAGNDQFEGAIQKFDEAIEKQKDYAAAYFHRGIAKVRLGQKDEAANDFEHVLTLPVDEAMRVDAERFVQNLRAPPAPPPDDPASAERRTQLINEMFNDDRATRIAAATALILEWNKDPQVIPSAIAAARARRANSSGVINTLVLLENMDRQMLMKHRVEINDFLDTLSEPSPGPQTALRIRSLRDLLRGKPEQ